MDHANRLDDKSVSVSASDTTIKAKASGCGIAFMAKASAPGRAKTRLVPPLTFEEAATLPCVAVTAWSALAGVRAGDTVLTQGSGGVAVFALQLAKLLGARVITTSRNAEDGERWKKLGASVPTTL